MPLYAFTCDRCGPFDARRPMAEAGSALACPSCGSPARRSFTPPGLSRMRAPLRDARDREERSAHAPDLVAAPSGGPLPSAHRHAHGPPWALGHGH
jgi:putative FmdB family regulatory protein